MNFFTGVSPEGDSVGVNLDKVESFEISDSNTDIFFFFPENPRPLTIKCATLEGVESWIQELLDRTTGEA